MRDDEVVIIKKIIKALIIALAMLAPVFANQYHAGDDNVSSNWLKPLNDYLFNEGVDQMNKDVNPAEWIPTANGPRLDYLHDDVHNNPKPYIINHYQQNLTDDNYTLVEAENKVITNKDFSLLKKIYTGFSYIRSTEEVKTSTNSGITNVINMYYNRDLYYVDLNMCLNNVMGWDYGTADVYINGKLVANDVNDYYTKHKYGTRYEIKDIKAVPGYNYVGNLTPISGTLGTYAANIRLNFKAQTFVLADGPTVNARLLEINKIKNIKSVQFIDIQKPSGVTEINGLDADNDRGIIGWYDANGNVYISTQKTGQKVIANANSSSMFSSLRKIESMNVSLLETKNVTTISSMFKWTGCDPTVTNFKITGLESWNTNNVTRMDDLFCYCGSNARNWDIGNIGGWNTSKVTTMNSMFMYAANDATSFDIGWIGDWNVSNVKDMGKMFYETGYIATTWYIGELYNWNVSNVVDMNHMFCRAGYKNVNIGTLSTWNTQNVTNMSSMFSEFARMNSKIELDLGRWNVGKVTNMSYMFDELGKNANYFFIGGLAGWDTSNVTNMDQMFWATAGEMPNNQTWCEITIRNPNATVYKMFEWAFQGTADNMKVYSTSSSASKAKEAVATKSTRSKVVYAGIR